MSEKRLSSQFDTDLTTINTKVLQMGGLVEVQIAHAVHALANFDIAMCGQVLAVEQEINTLEIEIDGDCNNIIARRQPAARDLRLIMAISKTIINLERAGDEAAKTTKCTKRLMQDPSAYALNYAGMDRSGKMAATILRHALDIFAYLDTTAAVSILQEDRAIDEEFRDFMRELVTYMMESPRTISVALDLLSTAKAIERISNHAKNVTEFIIYIVKGTDVRHAGHEALEREILGEGEQEGRAGDVSMPSSILVVEDELAIAELITVNLQHAGHYPIHTYNAEQALSLMSDVLPDLVLLDWMLLGKSGVMFAKELHANERTCQIPIITLTVCSEEQDKIMGLDNGADGYVTKPFSLKELLVHIKAVLRRRAPQLTDDVVAINGLRLDPATYRVAATNVKAESLIKLGLGPTEFRLLHFLMTYPERVHSRSQLLDQVWGNHVFVEERTVGVHIKRLRTALAPGGHSNMIETVRDNGYHLARNPGQ